MSQGNRCPVCHQQTLVENYSGHFVCTNCDFAGNRAEKEELDKNIKPMQRETKQ